MNGPIWRTRSELLALLARYRAAMATRSDTEMTAHIRGLR